MSRSLGSLTVDLIARTGGFQDGMTRAERAAQRSGRNISGSMKGASRDIEDMGNKADAAGQMLRRFATIAGAAFAGIKLTGLIRDAADLNSRYEQLGGIMTVVGRNAGLSAEQVNKYAAEVRGMGITMMESRQTVISMTQAQLDLSKASDLARVAQDAAAIAGINSTEALGRLINGIQSANTQVLRGVGINVQFEQGYQAMAAQLGKTTAQLTEAEKAQSRMNQVLAAGVDIAGSYEASMDSAAKQLGSTARYVEDLQVMWGAMFSEANRQLVFGYSDALKGLLDITEELYSDGSMEEWGRVVNHAMDAATALAVVLGARLAGSLATVAASKALATQQAIAYQLALARMSGLSAAAAGSQVALGAAVTTASRAMALVGGPVGVAVIAAAGIYTFREELGLVPYNAERAADEISRLAGSISSMSVATAEFNLINAREQLADAERSFATTQRSIEFFQAELEREVSPPKIEALEERLTVLRKVLEDTGNAAAGWRENIAGLEGVIRTAAQGFMSKEDILKKLGGAYREASSGAGEASEEVAKLIERLEQEQRQLTMTSKELLRYNLLKENATPEEIKHALSIHDTNEALKENKRATDAARKAVEQMLEAEAKASVGRQTTMDATRRQVEVLGRQVAVVGQGKAAQEALNRELFIENQLRTDAYRNLLPHQQEEYRKLIEQQYELQHELEQQSELAQIYEANWMRGIERVRDGFGDFFERMIIDGKASFSDLTDLFKKMIAEMIATAAANRIMIGLGFAGVAGGASAGGLGGGGGGIGLGDILSMKNLVSVLDSGFASVGNVILQAGGLISRAGGHFAIAASNMGMGLVAAGDAIGGAIGMTNMSAGAAAGLGGVATAGAGWAGGRIGSDLGLALTGKEGSGWGATGGAAIGAYVGSIVPVLGTMLGAALGGLIGGVVDSIFGSSAWNTTRGGLQLGFGEDGFDPMQWERQTKKGGLFSSTKRRYRFHELDDELNAALNETYDATLDSVRELYGILGVAVEDGVLEGVQIATLQIGTSGKSKQSQEAIEQQITQWFADLQEAAVQAIDPSLTAESLTIYASSLASVNEVFGTIGLAAYDVSIEGGKAAAHLLELSGGIENLLTATDFYYQNFYSAHERMGLLTEQTTAAFEAMGLALPESRQAFRDIVEGIDQTTEEGQALFLQLLNIAPAFADLTGRMADLDREADELRIELLKLSGDMEGAAAATKALATDGMSALEIAAWERNQSLLQQIEEQKRAQEELMRAEQDQIRAALEAADAAQKLATEQERAALQMARAQQQALSSIERSIGGLRERIILDQLGTPEAQYGYYKSQIDAMGGMIGGLSSPEAIASLVGQMTSLAGSAYGLLDESGRRERGSEYLTFLDNLQHQSTQAIERAEKRKAEEQAKILKEAMAEAGKIMAETIKVAIEDGSLEIQQAGVVMTAATNAFASKVNELNRSREVTG